MQADSEKKPEAGGERTEKERKGKERKGKERKGKERRCMQTADLTGR